MYEMRPIDDDIIHLVPDDNFDHEVTRYCSCNPKVVEDHGCVTYIHRHIYRTNWEMEERHDIRISVSELR